MYGYYGEKLLVNHLWAEKGSYEWADLAGRFNGTVSNPSSPSIGFIVTLGKWDLPLNSNFLNSPMLCNLKSPGDFGVKEQTKQSLDYYPVTQFLLR